MSAALPSEQALQQAIARDGHAHVGGGAMRALLEQHGALADWDVFADSWNDMPLDTYLADGSRYRRRRYAMYQVGRDGSVSAKPHGPHYQSRDYNRLFGDVERWFEPILPSIAGGPTLNAVLRAAGRWFSALRPDADRWHAEAHQFRIEARADLHGQPTPEGVHRDGVDYVLVLLVRRQNIASGTTTIHTPEGRLLGSFTLTEPLDAALIDDHRVYHGVTPVVPVDAAQPAYRDVLVVTLRREPVSG